MVIMAQAGRQELSDKPSLEDSVKPVGMTPPIVLPVYYVQHEPVSGVADTVLTVEKPHVFQSVLSTEAFQKAKSGQSMKPNSQLAIEFESHSMQYDKLRINWKVRLTCWAAIAVLFVLMVVRCFDLYANYFRLYRSSQRYVLKLGGYFIMTWMLLVAILMQVAYGVPSDVTRQSIEAGYVLCILLWFVFFCVFFFVLELGVSAYDCAAVLVFLGLIPSLRAYRSRDEAQYRKWLGIYEEQ